MNDFTGGHCRACCAASMFKIQLKHVEAEWFGFTNTFARLEKWFLCSSTVNTTTTYGRLGFWDKIEIHHHCENGPRGTAIIKSVGYFKARGFNASSVKHDNLSSYPKVTWVTSYVLFMIWYILSSTNENVKIASVSYHKKVKPTEKRRWQY